MVQQPSENLLLWRTTGVETGEHRNDLLRMLTWERKQAGDLLKEQISTAGYMEVQKAGLIVRGNTEPGLLAK